MTIRYRDVDEADFDWLLAVRRDTMNPHIRAMGQAPIEEINREAVRKDYDCVKIVAVGDAEVGMVKLVRHDGFWHLRQIQIAPEFQRQGVGRAVIEKILDDARAQSMPIVLNVLKVNPAKHLYDRLGFQVIETTELAYKMRWEP